MARFKPVGKKRTKAKAPAKQGQDNRCSHCQVFAAAAAAAGGAAAGAASPVTAVMPMEITFMDNGGNIFVLDEFTE